MFSFIPQLVYRKKPCSPQPETHALPWNTPGQPPHFILTRDTYKTLRIRVDAQGTVWVKAPRFLKQHDVLTLLERKKAWILRKQNQARQRPQPKPLTYLPGQPIYYLGSPYTLVFLPLSASPFSKTRAIAQLDGKHMRVYTNDPQPATIKRLVEQWFLRTATKVLAKRLATLRQRHALPMPQALKVRSLKARWGSCNHKGEICLAWQLMSVPLPCLDFVLVHELCHLVHLNHSPKYHALLKQHAPNTKTLTRDLALWQSQHPR